MVIHIEVYNLQEAMEQRVKARDNLCRGFDVAEHLLDCSAALRLDTLRLDGLDYCRSILRGFTTN